MVSASLSGLRSAALAASSPVLIFQRSQPFRIAHFHPAVLRFPGYYSVWSVTPNSLTSFTDRPDSICFYTAPMIFSSVNFVFFI